MALSVRARRAAVGGLLGAIVAVAAPAIAAPNKGYTVDVAGTALAGRTATFTVTFGAPAKQSLGSAKLTVPTGFTVSQVVADTTVAPTIDAASGTITLNGLEIPSGETEDVTVRADVACTGAASTWSVQAKQANEFNGEPGNFLQLDTANSTLITPVLGTCVPCPENSSADVCSDTKSVGPTSLTLRGLPKADDADAGQLTLAINAGLAIECDGYTELSADTALFDVSHRAKTARFTIPKNRLKGGSLQICFGSPEPFTGWQTNGTPYDWNGDGTPEPVYVGLLLDCDEIPVADGEQPCISFRSNPGDVIQANLPEGDPGMRT